MYFKLTISRFLQTLKESTLPIICGQQTLFQPYIELYSDLLEK